MLIYQRSWDLPEAHVLIDQFHDISEFKFTRYAGTVGSKLTLPEAHVSISHLTILASSSSLRPRAQSDAN